MKDLARRLLVTVVLAISLLVPSPVSRVFAEPGTQPSVILRPATLPTTAPLTTVEGWSSPVSRVSTSAPPAATATITAVSTTPFHDLPSVLIGPNDERYIVTFRSNSRPEDRANAHALAATLGATAADTAASRGVQITAANTAAEHLAIGTAARRAIVVDAAHRDNVLRAYRTNPAVQSVDVDRRGTVADIPNDPMFSLQTNLPIVNAPAAWDVTQGSSSVKIAILDTGILETHPDLNGKVVAHTDFSLSSSGTTDVFGHGTHVAGIAAASVGMESVLPD